MSYNFVGLPKCAVKPLPVPPSRVELHVHLDGAVRPETLWDLTNGGIGLTPKCNSIKQLKASLSIGEPKDLHHFLSRFSLISPAFCGNLEAIERIAREFVEDCAENGVAYAEARYSPTLLMNDGVLTGDQVVDAVTRGLRAGEAQYPTVKVRQILCLISAHPPEANYEVLKLCQKYRGGDVVGMDMAGDENCADFGEKELQLFVEAKNTGVRRTVHAGEDGPAENVRRAVDQLHAERIGHGYHVMDDPLLYKRCLDLDIHFEVNPLSSVLTGSVSMEAAATMRHPMVTFAKDNANFSISTDDPSITGNRLDDELQLVRTWGLNEVHVTRAQFNGARSSFLPTDEKKELIRTLESAYGVLRN